MYYCLEWSQTNLHEGTSLQRPKSSVHKLVKFHDDQIKNTQISTVQRFSQNNIFGQDFQIKYVTVFSGSHNLFRSRSVAMTEDRTKTYCGTLDYMAPEIYVGFSYRNSLYNICAFLHLLAITRCNIRKRPRISVHSIDFGFVVHTARQLLNSAFGPSHYLNWVYLYNICI